MTKTTVMKCAATASIDTHMMMIDRELGDLSGIAMSSTVARIEMIAAATGAIE